MLGAKAGKKFVGGHLNALRYNTFKPSALNDLILGLQVSALAAAIGFRL